MTVLASQIDSLKRFRPLRVSGRIAALKGLTILVEDLPLPSGSLVKIRGQREVARGEIVGFIREHAIVMVLGSTTGLSIGDPVIGERAEQTAPVSTRMLGRVINGLGEPIDGKGPIRETASRELVPHALNSMQRRRITEPLHTGVRVIDFGQYIAGPLAAMFLAEHLQLRLPLPANLFFGWRGCRGWRRCRGRRRCCGWRGCLTTGD